MIKLRNWCEEFMRLFVWYEGLTSSTCQSLPCLNSHTKKQYATPESHYTPAIALVFCECIVVGYLCVIRINLGKIIGNNGLT